MDRDWNEKLQHAAEQAGKTQSTIRNDGPAETPFCVYSQTGKQFGCYATRKEAEERLAQMEKFKHMEQDGQ